MMNSAERKRLKKEAFNLKPVILLGQKGLTDTVIAAIDEALTSHELIKVKMAGLGRDEYEEPIQTILQRCEAEQVSRIGRILTIYRPRPEQE